MNELSQNYMILKVKINNLLVIDEGKSQGLVTKTPNPQRFKVSAKRIIFQGDTNPNYINPSKQFS